MRLPSLLLSLLLAAGCTGSAPLLRQAADLNARGAALLARGDIEGAAASFHLALEYNDRFAEPHNNLGLVALARGRAREARAHFRAALARNPDFAEAWSNLGVALSRREGSDDDEATPQAAMDAWREALAINPGLVEPRVNLARTLLATGDATEALAQSRRVVQLADTLALGHALRAEAALAVRAWDEAAEAARAARAIAPQDVEVRLVVARVQLARGDYAGAGSELRALSSDPRVGTEARALLAALCLARGDRACARRELAALGTAGADHPVARAVREDLER